MKTLTVKSASSLLNVSKQTIKNRINNGDIYAEKRPSKQGSFMWEIPYDAIAKYLPMSPANVKLNTSLDELNSNPEHEDRPNTLKALEPYIKAFQEGNLSLEKLLAIQRSMSEEPMVQSGSAMPKLLNSYEYNWALIGDIHLPFVDDRALDWVMNIIHKHNLNKKIFLGDVWDNHAISFHDSDPNGLSAKDEFIKAQEMTKDWYRAIPEAWVMIGNHDALGARRVKNAGMNSEWLKPINEITGTPGWEFVTELETSHFVTGHGDDGKNIKNKVLKLGKSYIQGHYHSDTKLEVYSDDPFMYGMQVGCMVDKHSYAFKYAGKGNKRFIHSMGAIVDGDPLVFTMHSNSIFGKYYQTK